MLLDHHHSSRGINTSSHHLSRLSGPISHPEATIVSPTAAGTTTDSAGGHRESAQQEPMQKVPPGTCSGMCICTCTTTGGSKPLSDTRYYSVFSSYARILIDSGASSYFISYEFTTTLGLRIEPLSHPIVVTTPISGLATLRDVCMAYTLEIARSTMVFDLVLLDMTNLDIIIGMDWLSAFSALTIIDGAWPSRHLKGKIFICR